MSPFLLLLPPNKPILPRTPDLTTPQPVSPVSFLDSSYWFLGTLFLVSSSCRHAMGIGCSPWRKERRLRWRVGRVGQGVAGRVRRALARAGTAPAPAGRADRAAPLPWGPAARRVEAHPRSRWAAQYRQWPWAQAPPRRTQTLVLGSPGPARCLLRPRPGPPLVPCLLPAAAGGAGASGAMAARCCAAPRWLGAPLGLQGCRPPWSRDLRRKAELGVRAGEMDSLVLCLLRNHENLSSIPEPT